jgi:O-Antigen ligase
MPTMRPSKSKYGAFFALVLFCVAVPGYATAKAAAIVVFWTYFVIKSGFKLSSVIWVLSVLVNLLIWCIVASAHTVVQNDTANQCGRILIFFIVLGIGVYAVRTLEIEEGKLDNLIFYIAFLAMILKSVILVLVLGGWYSLEEVQKFVGFETVSDFIGLGLQRLQFPSDIVILFLLSCYVGGKNKAKDTIFLLSVTVVVVLSFSRFLFVGYLLCLILRYVWIRKIDLISWFSLGVILLLSAVFLANLVERFSGEGTSASDSSRVEQIGYLKGVISEYPFLGTGIGSSVGGYKRSETMPFSYEVEWYAMTMQFGYLGITWFGLNLIVVLFTSVDGKRNVFFFTAVLLIWIASGFTNPYVTSLGSAFGFSILMLRLSHHQEPVLVVRTGV